MIDIITVVFGDELGILQTQAASIDKFCKKLKIRSIKVIVNDDDNVAAQINPAWWGSMAEQVIVVPRSVFAAHWIENGWVTQQALKLMAASISNAPYSMILDAKTIFVRELFVDQVFDTSMQIQTGQLAVYAVFEPGRLIINKILGADVKLQAGPGGVPFVCKNEIVRELILEIGVLTGKPFLAWFQATGLVTEFLLYSGYVILRDGSLDREYSKANAVGNIVNVCHSEVAAWDRKFAEMQHPDTLTVSVHREAWKALTTEQRGQYRQFLLGCGISLAVNI